MELSQKLQNRRNEMKLTQEEVAEKIYVSRQTISNWETGRTLPDINSLVLISDVYDISLDNLIKEDNKMIKNLSIDSKQAENWFVFSSLLSNTLSVLISSQSNKLEINIQVLLLILQTIIVCYISISGYTFLKRNKKVLRKKLNLNSEERVVDGNMFLYGVTILCGFSTVVIAALTIS